MNCRMSSEQLPLFLSSWNGLLPRNYSKDLSRSKAQSTLQRSSHLTCDRRTMVLSQIYRPALAQ